MKAIVIDEVWCKGCGLCIAECNHEVLGWSGRRNAKGYNLPVSIAPEKCTGCGLCEAICPDLALTVKEGQA